MTEQSQKRQWLIESLKFFSDLDFYTGQDVTESGNLFKGFLANGLVTNTDADPEFRDLPLLERDQSRMWLVDGEFGVGKGCDRYVDFLEGLSAISRGTFLPLDIVEVWETDEGPITVTFTLDGELRQLHPTYLSDWLDGSVVNKINSLITGSGMQIEMYAGSSQVANILFLSVEEKHMLIEQRNWRFFDPKK